MSSAEPHFSHVSPRMQSVAPHQEVWLLIGLYPHRIVFQVLYSPLLGKEIHLPTISYNHHIGSADLGLLVFDRLGVRYTQVPDIC